MTKRSRRPRNKQEVIDSLNFYRAFYGREPLQVNDLHDGGEKRLRVKSGSLVSDPNTNGGQKPVRETRDKRLKDGLFSEDLQDVNKTNKNMGDF